VQIRVLGTIGVFDDVSAVSLTPQLRRLLGVLVVADGSTVSLDRLGEHLAADRLDDGSDVDTAIARLKNVLGERVETSPDGYRLRIEAGELDAARFLQLCERARASSSPERVSCLQRALDLWNGAAFGEFAREDWARSRAVHLDGARAVAVEDLAEALIDCGQPARAVGLLEPHLVEHPRRERPVGLTMRALAASGRVADALSAFRRLRSTLRDEIGIDPNAELRELEAELLGGLDPVRIMSAPPTTSLPTGTVTFMFTDIEGSTSRWQSDETVMSAELAQHDDTIRTIVEGHDGVVFKHTGDGVCAVFTSAPSAIDAAIEIQSQIALPVRIGVHTGEAELRERDYFGPALNRTARVMDAGHGGQILVSAPTASLSPAHPFADHGRVRLKGLPEPEHVFQVGYDRFPALRVVQDVVGNLPTELTSFVGRADDVSAIVETLANHRVITLIGVGGTGKTRLAVETARQVALMYPDGCWIVELAPVASPEAVPFAFAASLEITLTRQDAVVDVLVAHLRHRRAIVVVDNCEHVLDAAADVVERIAAECPSVVLLSTSREPLMLNGERLVPVASLSPDEAARLFRERALAENPDLDLDDVQSAAVATLCARLDGLPLAVELAASRIRAFTPLELLSMLDERFRLLVGGRRSRMERHQTMRGTVDWSYDLCDQTERAVFDRLSVFAATFDLGDARAVASGDGVSELDVIDTVPRLVDRSLLQRTVASDGTTRYRMLETMRAYGREHLKLNGTLDEAWGHYAEYVARTIGRLAVSWIGPDEERKLSRSEEYLADALVALDWLTDHREWNLAVRILGIGTEDRIADEIASRLYDALIASGDHPPEESVIVRSDHRRFQTMTGAELAQVGWAALQADEVVPDDWWARPAVIDVDPVTPGQAEAMIRTLARYAEGPPILRATACWAALSSTLARDFHPSTIEGYYEARSQLERLGEQSESRFVDGMLLEVRALEARCAGRYADAAEFFAAAAINGITLRRRGWWYLMNTWNSIIARVMSGGSVDLVDVAEAWTVQGEARQVILNFRGALATGMALDAVGERTLAKRFIQWMHDNAPHGFADMFPKELDRFGGHDVVPQHIEEDLDALVAALQQIAPTLHSVNAEHPL
jgi:predicted ATPase/class 3 adenylate cyclase